MNYNKLTFLITLVFFFNRGLFAQQGTITTGGDITGTGGTVSYSTGQADFMWYQGLAGSLNQGIQQPREFFTTSIVEIGNVGISAFVYPNPSTGLITINVQNIETSEIQYTLFNTQGQVISEGPLTGTHTTIDLSNTASGAYIMQLNIENRAIRIFRIIKQ